MLKTYTFNMINNGTENVPAWTFTEIGLANNSRVDYLQSLMTVRVTKEVTPEEDIELSKTDLTEKVYIERLIAFKAKADAVRASKVTPL